jgi:hypothetical protein
LISSEIDLSGNRSGAFIPEGVRLGRHFVRPVLFGGEIAEAAANPPPDATLPLHQQKSFE